MATGPIQVSLNAPALLSGLIAGMKGAVILLHQKAASSRYSSLTLEEA
jgi:hypothetical protein